MGTVYALLPSKCENSQLLSPAREAIRVVTARRSRIIAERFTLGDLLPNPLVLFRSTVTFSVFAGNPLLHTALAVEELGRG